MKSAYRLFKRGNGVYYVEHNESGQQRSLKTKDKQEAQKLFHVHNDAANGQQINFEIGMTYIKAGDPGAVLRTWQNVFDEVSTRGSENTQSRRHRLYSKKCFDCIRNKSLIETTSEDLLRLLKRLGSFDNAHLKLAQNYAEDIGWLSRLIVPRKLWPKIKPKQKRGVTKCEHKQIIAAEQNAERKAYYQLLWETGASQTDAANLTAENIDWENERLIYQRCKLGPDSKPAIMKLGSTLKAVLMDLPSTGPLFPKVQQEGAGARAAEFCRRIRLIGIQGVSLHSYRYAWAERARVCGYPERYALAALGHTSKAVHHAYAKNVEVEVPALEGYQN